MWGGSAERNREPMDKNRIRGAAEQGERATTAKLSWSRLRWPAVVWGKIAFLPGETSHGADLTQNPIDLAYTLGAERPYVAILSGESRRPEKFLGGVR